MVKPVGKNILVRQELTKKSEIITSIQDPNKDHTYEATSTIQLIGDEVSKHIKVGSTPIFRTHAEPVWSEIIEGKVGESNIVRLAIFEEFSLVGFKDGK